MAQYNTNSDFSTDADATVATGNAVATITGWTVISPLGGSPGSNSTYTITADAAAQGGKYCAAAETGWSAGVHFLRFDAPGTIAPSTEGDWLFRFRVPGALSSDKTVAKFLVGGSNYYALRVFSSGAARLDYYEGASPFSSVGAADSTPDRASTPAALVAGTWYWVRVHRTSAGAWSWKIWSGLVGDQPAGWSLGDGGAGGTSDTNVTTGDTGIGFMATNEALDFDWFSFATAGDAAPAPGGGGGDTTAPTYGSAPAVDSVTPSSVTIAATASDETSATVDHYAILLADGATAPADVAQAAAWYAAGAGSNGVLAVGSDVGVASGAAASITLSGLSASTAYDIYAFVEDESGNPLLGALVNATTAAVPTITLTTGQECEDNTRTPLASQTGVTVAVINPTTDALVVRITGHTTDANGLLAPITNAALTAGQSYDLIARFSGGQKGAFFGVTAA